MIWWSEEIIVQNNQITNGRIELQSIGTSPWMDSCLSHLVRTLDLVNGHEPCFIDWGWLRITNWTTQTQSFSALNIVCPKTTTYRGHRNSDTNSVTVILAWFRSDPYPPLLDNFRRLPLPFWGHSLCLCYCPQNSWSSSRCQSQSPWNILNEINFYVLSSIQSFCLIKPKVFSKRIIVLGRLKFSQQL